MTDRRTAMPGYRALAGAAERLRWPTEPGRGSAALWARRLPWVPKGQAHPFWTERAAARMLPAWAGVLGP